MFGWIFLGLLVSATICVMRFGDNEIRLTLFILVIAYIGTFISYIIGGKSWLEIQAWTVAWDGMAFICLLVIAFRSEKFWPLWIASFQLLPLLTFAAAPFGQNLVSQALGVAQGLWAYFQLLILMLVTIKIQMAQAKTGKSLPN
jgi:hypothetical protein